MSDYPPYPGPDYGLGQSNSPYPGPDYGSGQSNSPYPGPDYGSGQSNAPYEQSWQRPSKLSAPYPQNFAYGNMRQYGRQRWNWGGFCVVALVVLIIGAGVGVFALINVLSGGSGLSSVLQNPLSSQTAPGQVTDSTTIPSGAHPSIVINNYTNYVHVYAGKSNRQIVVGVINAPGRSDNQPLTYTSNGQTITIDASEVLDGDLSLTVPVTTDLKLDTDGIEVVGVSGQMSLSSPSEAIRVVDSTLTDGSTLDNNGGPVFVINSTLSGQVKLSNNGGPITFTGSLAPNGTYTLDTNGGSMDITLPADAAFHLSIDGIIDTLTSNFSSVATHDFNQSSTLGIGNAPTAKLALSINGGPIVLMKHRAIASA